MTIYAPECQIACYVTEMEMIAKHIDDALEWNDEEGILESISRLVAQTSWFREAALTDEWDPHSCYFDCWCDARDIQHDLENIASSASLRFERTEADEVCGWLLWRVAQTWWVNAIASESLVRPCPTSAPLTA